MGPGAPKIYDLVTRIDQRVDLVSDWMIRHKSEAAQRDEKLDEFGERLEKKIAEFEVAEAKVRKEADRVAIELRTTAENAARILAAKKDSDK
jgi:hypothetical protein